MKRIPLLALCEQFAAIRRLESNYSLPKIEYLLSVSQAEKAVDYLYFDEGDFGFKRSERATSDLLKQLNRFVKLVVPTLQDGYVQQPDDDENYQQAKGKISEQLSGFFRKFSVELEEAQCYLLEDVGLFNGNSLLEKAYRKSFDLETRVKFSKLTGQEFDQAAKCLAFGLHTACGFHVLRAAESVIFSYLDHLKCDIGEDDKNKNWGQYVSMIREKEGNEKIANHIYEIKEYHRNPIMHPQDTLSAIQAESLFGVCRTLMQSIADEMPIPEESEQS